MGTVIDLEAWRTRRETPLERLERAASQLEDLLSERSGKRAPAWLRDGVAEVRAALRARRFSEAAEQAEALVRRVDVGGR